jgi:DNA-binding MarR family transcriptional regulator
MNNREESTSQSEYRLIHDIYVLMDFLDNKILSEDNLTTSQYWLLRSLNKGKGTRLTDLGDKLLLSNSAITRIVDRLENRGLAKRLADPRDRRAQRVVLTDDGDDLISSINVRHLRSLDDRFSNLSNEENTQLVSILRKLKTCLE